MTHSNYRIQMQLPSQHSSTQSHPAMNNSPFVDPLSRLPIETFTHLFPFLPIVDIAKSSAVSRNWREAILSDSTLHQEVDLTRLKSEDTNDILVHLDRLSSRSRHKLVKVSLNLNVFYRQYIGGIDFKVGNATDSLVRSFSRSRDSLKRISLKIDGDGEDRFGYLSSHFLGPVLKLPSLQKVSIQLNQLIEFQAGEDIPSSKVFSVTRATRSKTFGTHKEDFDKVLETIEAAVAFVRKRNSLVELSLSRYLLRDPDGRLTMELIRNHSSTLRNLSINLRNLELNQMRGLLCAGASCASLTHLILVLEASGNDEDDEVNNADPVVLEEGLRCCNLKEIKLETDIRLDWNSWSRWCGDSLQRLWISIRSSSSPSPAPFIFKSSSTLIELTLEFSGSRVEDTFANHLPPFPNLSEVTLKGLSSSSLELFGKLDVKNLTHLTLLGTEETRNETFSCLHGLLENYSSTLRYLMMYRIGDDSFTSPTTAQLHVSRLRSLMMSSCHPDVFEWLSTLFYPSLTDVHLYGPADSDEVKAQFKMNSPKLTKWTFKKQSAPF